MAIDWRKNVIEFETDEGTVFYKYTGTRMFVRDKRKEVIIGKRITWEADGTEETPFDGECTRCGKRTFVYGEDNKVASPPQDVVDQMGLRIAYFVRTSSSEPPAVYCGNCVYRDNPHILEVIAEGKRATAQVTEEDKYLANLTAVFGGTR